MREINTHFKSGHEFIEIKSTLQNKNGNIYQHTQSKGPLSGC